MAEIWFYHFVGRPLEHVLTPLLIKTGERGWRSVVQTGDPERSSALSSHLWAFSDDSFLAHGTSADGYAERQPIWITDKDDNPNGASVRFFVDATHSTNHADYERVIYLFDGNNEHELTHARKRWKELKDSKANLAYWKQNEHGSWEKKA